MLTDYNSFYPIWMEALKKKSGNFAGDQGTLRKVNLTAVLNRLRQQAPISRADLADETGLNKATITRLIADLIEHGFVRETGTRSSSTGRPSILLELDPDAGYIIGVRLDIDYSTVILTNFAAEVIWRYEEPHSTKDGQEKIQQNLLNLIKMAEDHAPKTGRPILGLGLSLPGLVDVDSGALLFAPNLGWRNVPMREWLQQYFDCPIYVDNEANLAALGESYFGAARDCDYVLHVNITSGVGAGIVVHQQIFPGTSGLAGEVGHMTIDPHGPRCNCGNIGCWETFVSGPAIFRQMRDLILDGQSSILDIEMLDNFNRLSVPLVVEAAENGDPVAEAILNSTSDYIGLGLANLINLLNPQRVVLGGYLCPAYPRMLKTISDVVQNRALRWTRDASEIVIAQYGSDASLMGAIATIYNHALSFPIETLARSVESAHTEGR
ncbi:MAG: ROK family transcriptional regulator [Anaerolineaceae bacterium]|nr:ROK family transcriptional regulator [Anaerolineaceae bacterium]